jgi:protein-S-isoprenylcysteine O-methyltransferase Ste14
MTANPGWPIAANVVRLILYGAFVLGAAVILGTAKGPRRRDGRARVFVASMVATFLLVAVGLLPVGPVAWEATVRSSQIGLLIAAVGASVAVAALVSLGSNFSIVPEAHSLVVTGPYRWLRHPMYMAEFLMMLGIAVSDPRIVFLTGSIGVGALQVYRIRVEERLLSTAFPRAYEAFITSTRYRLVPHVW